MSKTNTSTRTLLLVETAMLIAIILVMAFTPLGYLKVGALSLTLIMIPVVIGAINLGPAVGALLGLVFGLTSFAQCFMGDAFGAMLVSASVVKTFVVCVCTRTLAGWLCGVIYKACSKHDKKGTWSYLVGSISGPILNTLLFLSVLALLFFKLDMGESTMLKTVIGIAASVNAPIEIALNAVIGTAIAKGLSVALKRFK